ncbi:hypothetical protein HK099_002062, partial [Clydaea vesicula]
ADLQLYVKTKGGKSSRLNLEGTCSDCDRACNTLPASVAGANRVQLVIPANTDVFVGFFEDQNCGADSPVHEVQINGKEKVHRVDLTSLLKQRPFGSLIWGDLSDQP